MEWAAEDLERAFRECFLAEYATILVGGGREPVYLPSADPDVSPHRVVYREDYLASALHEIAHWCLAGRERRRLEDYGYWYRPDGRSAEEQAEFERAEARPQALEWIFSDACGVAFHLSADNLSGVGGAGPDFEARVRRVKRGMLEAGLPARAARFLGALIRGSMIGS